MKKIITIAFVLAGFCALIAQQKPAKSEISDIATKTFTEFKVLDSGHLDLDALWKPFENELNAFTIAEYNRLKPFILEQPIPAIQQAISEHKFTYEALVTFYLYRIKMFDRANELSLNSIISLNPNAIKEAKARDEELKTKQLSVNAVFGMPILLKDNINTAAMPTTAGAVALQNNSTSDAFITAQLKQNGAIVLGKTNLSEWAYFFCGDCPSGYSAIGGQTLNPYGRKIIDTGGSSSGSGVAIAANFAVAAVGSETSGSILSPSSQNNLVGLKPTIGALSRTGIVPISSTLDTPGPMSKFVIDNIILFNAMLGKDALDDKSYRFDAILASDAKTLEGKRFGAFKNLISSDSLYANALLTLKALGATIIEIEEEKIELPNFISLLNLDMRKDLPKYLTNHSSSDLKSVSDIVAFNTSDSVLKQPYGQKLFRGIIADAGNLDSLITIKNRLKTNGSMYFDVPMQTHQLDGVLSINNYHAGYAAVAEYPALTVPMGFKANNEPKGMTFIAKPKQEEELYKWALLFESALPSRKLPSNYN